MNKEANEEESKSRKRDLYSKRERFDFNSERICPVRLSTKVFEFLCPFSEVELVGNPLGFSLCLPASPPVVLVVIVPFSDANVDCEVVFSDSGCEFVEPQTLSPLRKREASVALERETEMNIEGSPVRKRPTPQSSPLKAVPECMRSRAPPPQEGTPLRQTATFLDHQRIHQLWSTRCRWTTRYQTQSLTSFTPGDR